MNDSKLKTSSCRPFTIFDECFFAIPAYQRAYSWKEEHINQFILDLESHQDDGNRIPYNYGAFQVAVEPKDAKKYWVVDGQQSLPQFVFFSHAHVQFCLAKKANKLNLL